MNNISLFAGVATAAVLVCMPMAVDAHAVTLACTNLPASTLSAGSSDTPTRQSVTQLQNFLHIRGFLSSESTGYFGKLTTKAVIDFQASEKLETVGTVGPKTRAAIQRISCAQPSAAIKTPSFSVHTPLMAAASAAQASAPQATSFVAESFSNWKTTWGSVSATSSGTGSLYLNATKDVRGAEAIFADPESSNWKNYYYTASVIVSNGDVTLISRYIDEKNFLGCTFAGNRASVIERRDGKTQILASTVIADMKPAQYFMHSTNFSMRVHGLNVGCGAMGTEDNVSYTLQQDNPLVKGTIGIATWGLGAATLELKAVRVQQL